MVRLAGRARQAVLSDLPPEALTLAHLALAIIERRFFPAALIFLVGLGAGAAFAFFRLAHRAFRAAAILARTAADMVRFFETPPVARAAGAGAAPSTDLSSSCSASIRSLVAVIGICFDA